MSETVTNKFIVIPVKYAEKMSGKNRQRLSWILQDVAKQRRVQGKTADPRYYVCNQDEPYAGKVIRTILDGEDAKRPREKRRT